MMLLYSYIVIWSGTQNLSIKFQYFSFLLRLSSKFAMGIEKKYLISTEYDATHAQFILMNAINFWNLCLFSLNFHRIDVTMVLVMRTIFLSPYLWNSSGWDGMWTLDVTVVPFNIQPLRSVINDDESGLILYFKVAFCFWSHESASCSPWRAEFESHRDCLHLMGLRRTKLVVKLWKIMSSTKSVLVPTIVRLLCLNYYSLQ